MIQKICEKKAASPKVEEVELKSESTNEDNLKEDSGHQPPKTLKLVSKIFDYFGLNSIKRSI